MRKKAAELAAGVPWGQPLQLEPEFEPESSQNQNQNQSHSESESTSIVPRPSIPSNLTSFGRCFSLSSGFCDHPSESKLLARSFES